MAPLTFAHRGGTDGGFRENSLDAFGDALRRGCQVETDLRLSSDGQVVCAHDAISVIGFRPAWIAHSSAARLDRLGIPTLERLYRELGTGFEVSADIKAAGAAGPAIAVARTAGAVRRLWLVSADLGALAALRELDPDVKLVHETRHADLAVEPVSPHDHLARLAAQRVDAANTIAGDWTADLVEHAHRLGLAALGSLLQTRAAMDRAVALGLDGFYSDHLDLMRDVVRGAA